VWGEEGERVGKGGDRGMGEEMTQTLYAYMNKKEKKWTFEFFPHFS
jgi:hypothetical protein